MISVIGIIVSLVLLIYLAYRGWSIVLLAPVLALIAASFNILAGADFHMMATYTETFMTNMAGYIKTNFPIFMLGAVFGKVMDVSGSAKSIAEWITRKTGTGKELWAVVLSCALITYGGVSLFVAVFAIYPIGAALFRSADIPKRFLPGAIALGAFTFTMTALPGSPQVQNAIPMSFFGTDAFAAPILGIIAAIVELALGMAWLTSRVKKAKANGEGYGNHENEMLAKLDLSNLPTFTVSVIPIVVVLAVNLFCSKVLFPSRDSSYLETAFNTSIGSVVGNWSLISALIIGTLVVIVLNYKRFDKSVVEILKDGVGNSFLAIMNTASEVGYGNVIKTLAGYTIMGTALLGISSNPLIVESIASSLMAGITGSASGGLSIALSTFSETLLAQAEVYGLDPQVLHRVAAIACGGFDTLPHNGAVITLLAATGMTHRQSYVHIGMCTVAIPTVATVVIILLAMVGVC